MPLRRLLPLLSCPLCAVENRGTSRPPLLRHPFTLHCGHTVCSSHLNTLDPAQPCPLPVCSSTPNPNTIRPNIPSSSGVIYLPAAPPPSARRPTPPSADQRVDITISKLIEVVSRHSGPPPPPIDEGDSGPSDGDDCQDHPPGQRSLPTTLPSSDEETEFPATRGLARSSGQRARRRRRGPELASRATISESTLTSVGPTSAVSADSAEDARPSPSERAGRSCPPLPPTAGGENSDGDDSSPEPPKKRPRRGSRFLATDRETETPEAETGNSDYPNANTSHPSRSGAEPRHDPVETGGEDPQTRIDKELLTELNCEICFTIYYQPVTTPCQHVSRLFFFFFRNLSSSLPFHKNSGRGFLCCRANSTRSRCVFFFYSNPILDPEVFISFLPILELSSHPFV